MHINQVDKIHIMLQVNFPIMLQQLLVEMMIMIKINLVQQNLVVMVHELLKIVEGQAILIKDIFTYHMIPKY